MARVPEASLHDLECVGCRKLGSFISQFVCPRPRFIDQSDRWDFPRFFPSPPCKKEIRPPFLPPRSVAECEYRSYLLYRLELFDLSPSPAAAGRHHPPGQHLPNLPAQEVVPTRPLPRPKVRRPRVGRDLPRPPTPQLELLARPRSLAASRQRVHRGPRVPVARVTRPSSPSPH